MKKLIALLSFILIVQTGFAQQQKTSCGFNYSFEKFKTDFPLLANFYSTNVEETRATPTVFEIPVVVHIVYKNESENLSDDRIFHQLEILNRDFSGNGIYRYNIPFVWNNIIAKNCNIKFKLATIDPNGVATNGITRTKTCEQNFSFFGDCGGFELDSKIKHTTDGGINAWDTHFYMNIWVGDIGTSLLGISSFPTCIGEPVDGIVISKTVFGIDGGDICTTTHETGHYLGLFHNFGDATIACDDDGDPQTPLEGGIGVQSIGFETNFFPIHDACSPAGNGIMFMNFMDYNDDMYCNSFTVKQMQQMRKTLGILNNVIGPRNSLINNNPFAAIPSIYNSATDFKIWNNTTSFRCIELGKEGQIWTGTSGGGMYRHDGLPDVFNQNPNLTNHYVRAMTRNNAGEVFIGSSELSGSAFGAIRKYSTAGSFTPVIYAVAVAGTPSKLVNSLCTDNSDRVWGAFGQSVDDFGNIEEGGYGFIDGSLFDKVLVGLPGTDIRCLSIGSTSIKNVSAIENQIWISIDKSSDNGVTTPPQLIKVNADNGAFLGVENIPTSVVTTWGTWPGSPTIKSICGDKSGRVWLGVNGGSNDGVAVKEGCGNFAWHLFKNTIAPMPIGAIVNANAITEDYDGNIWIGTTGGLIKISGGNFEDNSAWKIYTTADGLPSNSVTGITFDFQGNIWCSTSAGIFRGLNCPQVQITSVTNSSCGNSVGNIELKIKGGSVGDTYNWSKDNQSFASTQNLSSIEIGQYNLQITNSVGTIGVCLDRTVDVAPSNVYIPEYTVPATSIQSCGATLNFTSNSLNEYWYSIYSLPYTNGDAPIFSLFDGPGINSLIIESSLDILPQKNIRIDVSAKCANDVNDLYKSIPNRNDSVTTSSCKVPQAVAHLLQGTSGVKINWGGSDCQFGYELQYRKVGTPNWIIKLTTNTQKTIQNLTPGNYECKVRGFCTNQTPITDNTLASIFTPIHNFTITGIKLEDISVDEQFTIYPNPTSSEINIQYNGVNSFSELRIYNNVGQLVYSNYNPDSVNFNSINISNFTDGVYFVELVGDEMILNSKFIKISL